MRSEFNDYMMSIKNKSLSEKERLLFKQMSNIAALANTMCKEIGVDNKLLVNDNVLDIMKSEYTQDEYIEAVMVLASSIQESLCDFDNKISDIIEGTIE